MIGKTISHYKITEKLGEGGMGMVYRAEQTYPVRRQVAVKILKIGLNTAEFTARFESERQALALMDHPYIARVFDAGTTERGRPYFVMEFVDGVPITQYCDELKMGVHDRLQLFIQICEGIQHAHQKAIIHRDIKPSNVLVTSENGRAWPKIIDFGVAKALNQKLSEDTVQTVMGQIMGTPDYMSPEQAGLAESSIDTRTDIFLLGNLLYILLTGVPPFDPEQLKTQGLEAMLYQVRNVAPPRPSQRLVRLADDAEAIANHRSTTLAKLIGTIEGDLDWITMRALEKEQDQRYQTSHALIQDVCRHLNDEPVLAGPPSTSYRIRKFVRRNQGRVFAAALLLATLILGISGTTVGLIRSKLAESKARTEAEVSREVSDFLVGLFKVSDPSEALGNTITAREILDRGSERIEKTLADQPNIQARMMATMGEVYLGLGLFQQALDLAEDALRVRQSIHDGDHPKLVESMMLVAQVLIQRGELDRAESIGRDSLAASRRMYGDHDSRTADCLQDLAVNLSRQKRLDEAEDLYRQALTIRITLEPADRRAVASTLTSLGELLRDAERLDEAEAVHREALELVTSIDDAVSPLEVSILNNLALVASAQGDLDASETRLREVHDLARELYGEQSPLYATAKSNLAGTLWKREKIDEAETLHRQALAIRQAALRPDHPDLAASLNNLSLVMRDRGDLDEAISLLEEALAIVRVAYGESHFRVGITLNNLGMMQENRGDYREALKRYLESEPALAGFLPPDHWRLGKLNNSIGLMLAHDGQFDRGEPLLLAGYETIRLARGDTDRRTRRALARVIQFYELAGRKEDVAKWQQVLESVTPEG